MFLDFIADAVDSIGSIGEVVKAEVSIRKPDPVVHIGWDWEEGKPKLEIKDNDLFDPRKY